MFCPNCARENLSWNKFCNGCGAPLQVEFILPQIAVLPPPPPTKTPIQIESPEKPVRDLEPDKKNTPASMASKTIEENLSGEKKSEAEKVASSLPAPVIDFDKTEQREEFSKVFEDAESLLDKIFIEEKSVIEPESPSAAEITAPETTSQKTILPAETPPAENFDDYVSEVENKYRASQSQLQISKNTNLIYKVSAAVAAVIVLGGLIGVGWYLIGGSKSAEIVAENKTPVIDKTNSDQPPPAEMVFVAGGEFMMGSDGGDEFSRPAHRVSVKPFYIDKTEVTCEEYKKFVDATGHTPPSSWQNNNFPPGAARNPVTGVNWDDATAFAKWKNKRLPTEEEWEFAARSTDGRIYPWGNVWKPEMANADKQKTGVQEVGLSSGQSPFGVFDMSGNAWEWTSTDAKPYSGSKSFETNSANAKIIRGGFFGSSKEKATTDFRRAWGARSETDYNNTSFRCARDVPAAQTSK